LAEKETIDVPEEALAAMGIDEVEVKTLVDEYLEAQSLKILPQAPFGDAVRQFVDKDDKHAMEVFVQESLVSQVKNMMDLEGEEPDYDNAMERYKATLDARFKAGELKKAKRMTILPKPDGWDSDLEGHWEDQPEARQFDHVDDEENGGDEEHHGVAVRPPNAQGRGRRAASMDENGDAMDMEEEEPVAKPRGRGAATRKPGAKSAAKPTAKAPAKKPPAKNRGRKAIFEESDDEEEMEEAVLEPDEISVDMDDEPSVPPLTKRTMATRGQPARSQPARSQPARTQASRAAALASKSKQTKLNFSQSQKPSQAMEISDDEISDDPFETAPPKRTSKR
jgi:double-strand break repair protein MRE11